MRARIVSGSPNPNGGSPSTAANRLAPREKTSDGALAPLPLATSGETYTAVPLILPLLVTVCARWAEMP